jgi:hypothetical protein
MENTKYIDIFYANTLINLNKILTKYEILLITNRGFGVCFIALSSNGEGAGSEEI